MRRTAAISDAVRKLLHTLVLVAALAACTPPAPPQAADGAGARAPTATPDASAPAPAELAAGHIEAIGGRSAVERVRGYHARGRMEMPPRGQVGTVEEWIRPGSGWRDVWEIGGFGTLAWGFDGEIAWSMNPDRAADVLREPSVLKAFAVRSILHPELDPPRHLRQARTAGRREVGGRETWDVRVRTAAGTEESRFYDAETGRLHAVEREETLIGRPNRVLTIFEDWRPVDGVLFPHRVTRSGAGMPTLVAVLDSVSTAPLRADAIRAPAPILAAASEDRHAVEVETEVMVPMRDGVRLAADIYRPVGAGERLPVILIRLPYDRELYLGATIPAQYFAERGYAVVVQDSRGKWDSEGEYVVSQSARNDGYDTVEWAASQPWSTGRVGTYGCSYLGENQVMLAAERHPAHLAMIPQAAGGAVGTAGGRYGYFGFYEGGAFSLSAGVGWFPMAGTKDHTDRQVSIPVPEGLRHLPTVDIMSHYGVGPTDWEEVLTRPLGDPWWQTLGYIADADSFATPALHVNSWYDLGAAETLQLFQLMQRNAVDAHTRDHQYVILSPTTHCMSERATENTRVGELDFGDARFPYRETYVRWFDHWLKGEQNGVTRMPRVQYYVTGANEWRSADEWPIPGARPTRFYLHSDGAANSPDGGGALARRPPTADQPADRYVYDPADPVPSRGGSVCCTGNPADQPGAFDQSDIEQREDVLTYTTPPLERALDVVGPLRAMLHFSSSARDTDFTVKLVDVHPDGRAFNVQEGITRARYREGLDRQVWMEPGIVYEVPVDLHATAHRFRAGHRIRVEVSSSNFPRFDRNLNTGGDNVTETEWVRAENAVHHSAEHPSHLLLPIVDRP